MMVFVYARIFVAARSRARRHIKKKGLRVPPEVTNDPVKEKSTTTTTCTSLSNPSPPENQTDQNKDEIEGGDDGVVGSKPYTPESSPVLPSLQLGTNPQIAVISGCDTRIGSLKEKSPDITSPTSLSPPQIVVEAIAESHYSSPTKEIAIISNNFESSESMDAIDDESDVQIKCSKQSKRSPNRTKRLPKLTIVLPESDIPEKASIVALPKQNGSATRTSETRFISNDEDSDAIESPFSKDTLAQESKTFLSAPKLLKSTYGSTLSIADYEDSDLCADNNSDEINKKHKKNSSKGRVQYHNPPVVGIHTPSDAERNKRKIAKARERRATLILGLIMAAFITAWLPFFVLYVLAALCEPCKEGIPSGVFAVAFWLGYCNSGKFSFQINHPLKSN